MKRTIESCPKKAASPNAIIAKKYLAPNIERIKLDNEISLILLSGIPDSPGGAPWGKAEKTSLNDPFKTTMG
jgi:hypothetical protein